MDGPSASKVERREIKQPAIGIPDPASNRAIDNRRPKEPEDERRNNTSTLERATDDDFDRACTEQHLIETEDNIRDIWGSNRRSSANIHHSKVRHIADERSCGTGVRKGEPPKHPLEC